MIDGFFWQAIFATPTMAVFRTSVGIALPAFAAPATVGSFNAREVELLRIPVGEMSVHLQSPWTNFLPMT